MHQEFLTQPTDEILESIWCLREEGRATLPALLARMPDADTESLVDRLRTAGVLRLTGDSIDASSKQST